MRFRHFYMVLGTILTMLVWLITDPDAGVIQNLPFGTGLIASLAILLKTVVYVGMLHLSRRALIDYVDLRVYFERALQTAEGAGQATIAIAIIMLSLSITMFAATVV